VEGVLDVHLGGCRSITDEGLRQLGRVTTRVRVRIRVRVRVRVRVQTAALGVSTAAKS